MAIKIGEAQASGHIAVLRAGFKNPLRQEDKETEKKLILSIGSQDSVTGKMNITGGRKPRFHKMNVHIQVVRLEGAPLRG